MYEVRAVVLKLEVLITPGKGWVFNVYDFNLRRVF